MPDRRSSFEKACRGAIPTRRMGEAIEEVVAERTRQLNERVPQGHVEPDEWLMFIAEKLGAVESASPAERRKELVQVAAVCVAAIEAIDHQQEG